MGEVMYTDFAEYIIKKDKYKKNFVRGIKKRGPYSPKTDYYLQLRVTTKQTCKKLDNLNKLDEMVSKLTNSNKKNSYPALIAKIKEFLASKKYTWVEPSKEIIQYGNLAIRINPELGLRIGNTTYFIKLYLKKPKITMEKINILKKIMQEAYSKLDENIHVAVFDARSGNLYSIPIDQTMELPYNLNKEASNWCKDWEELDN